MESLEFYYTVGCSLYGSVRHAPIEFRNQINLAFARLFMIMIVMPKKPKSLLTTGNSGNHSLSIRYMFHTFPNALL